MNIKISIIIPVYNVAPYLDACLCSCINQTFRDIEIIVVNDGSPDMSYQIIAAYAAMDERIVVVDKENEGLIYARKSGLDIARGEYVFHLDGDDYIERTALEELYKEAIDKGSDYVMGGNYYIFSNNSKKENRVGREAVGLCGQDLLFFLLGRPWFEIWGRLIRKELFDGIVYRDVFMGEDLYLNMQVALNVKNAAVVDACLYNYVRRSTSITNQNSELSFHLNMKMVESIFSLLDVCAYDQRMKERIYVFFYPFFIWCICNNRPETTQMLRNYFWNKKEVKAFLWAKKKDFYLMCEGYLSCPEITRLGVKMGARLLYLLKGRKLF